jgi:hypothetical protein
MYTLDVREMTGPTGRDYARWAEQRTTSREASVRRDRTDPKRIAARAAGHRANAEAFLELAALRNKPQYVEMAMREYELAYGEEH